MDNPQTFDFKADEWELTVLDKMNEEQAKVSVSVCSTKCGADIEQKNLEAMFDKIIAYGKVRFEQEASEHPIRGTEYNLYAYVNPQYKDYLWTFLWGYAWGKTYPNQGTLSSSNGDKMNFVKLNWIRMAIGIFETMVMAGIVWWLLSKWNILPWISFS